MADNKDIENYEAEIEKCKALLQSAERYLQLAKQDDHPGFSYLNGTEFALCKILVILQKTDRNEFLMEGARKELQSTK